MQATGKTGYELGLDVSSSFILLTMLLVAGTLSSVMASSSTRVSPDNLLRGASQRCYNYNQTLGICFDVRKSSMQLLKTTGEKIVFYMELGPNMFYYQVVDQGFIG